MQKISCFRWKLAEKSFSKVDYFIIAFTPMLQLSHSALRLQYPVNKVFGTFLDALASLEEPLVTDSLTDVLLWGLCVHTCNAFSNHPMCLFLSGLKQQLSNHNIWSRKFAHQGRNNVQCGNVHISNTFCQTSYRFSNILKPIICLDDWIFMYRVESGVDNLPNSR